MRVGILRSVFGACLVMGLIAVTSPAAQAQVVGTDSTSPLVTAVTVEAAALSAARSSQPTPRFTPRLNANFQQQTPPSASTGDEGIGVGVLAMITRANLNDANDVLDFQSRTGTGFGLWIGGNRNGTVGFTGEFIFLTRKYSNDFGEGTLRVFEIPAVFHVNFGSRSRNSVGGYVVVGPAFSFNLKESFTGGFGEDNFGGVDIGIIGGLGVEFFRIGIEGRGNWGVKSISDEGDVLDIKTFTFELLGKFAFN